MHAHPARFLSSTTTWAVAAVLGTLALAPAADADIVMTDVTAAAGLDGEIYRAATGHGLGVVWIDYDVDGWPDLLMVNGKGFTAHLYRNAGDGTFVGVDELLPALPDVEMMQATYADYDNDGDPDVYVFTDNRIKVFNELDPLDGPPNLLLKNLWVENGGAVVPGQPLFEEVSVAAGVDDLAAVPYGELPGYRSATGGFLDYDRDGWVDLYVSHWSCINGGHEANRDRLYRNNGDGTFSDVTVASGINTGTDSTTYRPTLAFFAGHLDDDLWPDLYVANVADPSPYHHDFIFRNNGDGTFSDVTATFPGVGDDAGAAMGIDVADVDLDGNWDLYISDLVDNGVDSSPAGNVFYQSTAGGVWQENSAPAAGVVGDNSWGVSFFDADQDRDEDLFVGAINEAGTRDNFLYRNDGGATFTDVATAAGVQDSDDVRGSAVADYDGDGDLDLAVVHQEGNLRLWRNDTTGAGGWLKLSLRPQSDHLPMPTNRSAIGTLARLEAGGDTLMRQVVSTVSTHSQNAPGLHFGLGAAAVVDSLEISWPSGVVDQYQDLAADQHLEAVEGVGVFPAGTLLFGDGFESGNTAAWSTTSGAL